MFNRTRPKQKTKVGNPAADFAYRFDMITRQEYEGILKGNAYLSDRKFQNLDLDLPYLPTGEVTKIYPGRASDIMINRLLDI